MEIKAVHIDDEKRALSNLKLILKDAFPEVKIIGQAQSVLEAIKVINQKQPDVVFLDIAMPNYNGFDLLDTIGNINFEVIFLTAYNQYAIQAIKRNALDYLLKPIDEVDLRITIDKVKVRMKEKEKFSNRLFISTANDIEFIDIDKIIYLKADNNYTTIYTENKQAIVSSKTLKYFENILDSQSFLRVHQSYIVSISKITKVIKEDNGLLVMSDMLHIPVSRSNKKTIFDLFKM